MIKFTATALPPGKKGVLTPDASGYYEMVVGGLNVFNSVGEYYTYDGAVELFKSSSSFMRRVTSGCLKGEVGHPKRLPGMSMDDYLRRILTIEETNVCCHFKEVWLDESYGKNNPKFNNPNLVAIMAKIKPSGPKGDYLRQAFENGSENVCFSIRALTKDYYQRGQTIRVLDQIVCWDNVVEPGIAIAKKWESPALECYEDIVVDKITIDKVIASEELVATEDSKQLIKELYTSVHKVTKVPKYTNW